MRTILSTSGLAVVLFLTSLVHAQDLKPAPVPALPPPPIPAPPIVPSEIRLPVAVNLPSTDIVEDKVCEFYSGDVQYSDIVPLPYSVDAKYEIWRDKPLSISFSQNVLTVAMKNYYWIEGVFSPLGLPIYGQCGMQSPVPFMGDEVSRQMRVTMDSRIDWHREWRLSTTTSVRPFEDLGYRCIVTAAKKDITDNIFGAGEAYLRRAATALDQRIGEVTNVTSRAADIWSNGQEPIPLGPNIWLQIAPEKISAGPIQISDTTPRVARTIFGLTARPRVVVGTQPQPGNLPLPYLEPLAPGPDGFHVVADAEISFDEANRLLQSPLSGIIGAKFSYKRKELEIKGIKVYGSGSKLAVELDIVGRALMGPEPKVVDVVTAVKKGYNRIRYCIEKKLFKLKGKIYLVGTPEYQSGTREVIFPDLEFDIETKNVLVKFASWILKTRLNAVLRERVRVPLGDKLDRLKSGLDAGLNRPLGDHAMLSGRVDSLTVQNVFVGHGTINGRAQFDGKAQIVASWP